jgi:hypothetical protein
MTTILTKIQPSIKKLALQNTIISVAKAILLSSCASSPTIVHDTVGPALAAVDEGHNGVLIVYSATAWTSGDDDGPRQLNYTDYQVSSADGTALRQVTNGDDQPARVSLPKGNYTVMAESDNLGTVNVPVAIAPGKTTILHLEREKDWKTDSIPDGDLVRLPNGQPIGFRSPHRKLSAASAVTLAQAGRTAQ